MTNYAAKIRMARRLHALESHYDSLPELEELVAGQDEYDARVEARAAAVLSQYRFGPIPNRSAPYGLAQRSALRVPMVLSCNGGSEGPLREARANA